MLQSNRKKTEFSLQDHLDTRLGETQSLQERLAGERLGFLTLVAVIAVVCLVIIGISGYFAVQKYQAEKAALAIAEQEAASAAAAALAIRQKAEGEAEGPASPLTPPP